MKKSLLSLVGLVLLTASSFGNEKDEKPYLECFEKACKIEYVREPWLEDYWKTPEETLFSGKGDCEDKSFYLYDLLKKKGIESRIVLGYHICPDKIREYHIWVEYNCNGEILILDSATKEIHKKSDFEKKELRVEYIESEDIEDKLKVKDFIERYESERKRRFDSFIGLF